MGQLLTDPALAQSANTERGGVDIFSEGRRMASQPGQAAFVAGASSNPTSMVELSLSCNNLADMDTFSKSDPFAVLYLKDSRSGHWVYVDRTETIDNTLNPQWAKKFILEFQFEKRQLMKIEVYDADSNSPNLTDHDFIGSVECSLGEILRTQGRGDTRPLVGVKRDQTITLLAEELLTSREVIKLRLEGRSLDRKDWWGFGTSDPFLTIQRAGEYGQWRVVHRTEVKKGNLNPCWQPMELTLSSLCNADPSTLEADCGGLEQVRKPQHDRGSGDLRGRSPSAVQRRRAAADQPKEEEQEEGKIQELGIACRSLLSTGDSPNLPRLHPRRNGTELHSCHRLHFLSCIRGPS